MTRFLAVLSGLLMLAAVGIMAPIAAGPGLILVVLGWRFRWCAVGAVLLAVGVLAWAEPGVLAAAATGLVATTYLLNTATVSAPAGVVPTTVPSVTGALGFTVAALAVSIIPLHLTWAPLLAPIVVIALFALLIQGLAVRSRD